MADLELEVLQKGLILENLRMFLDEINKVTFWAIFHTVTDCVFHHDAVGYGVFGCLSNHFDATIAPVVAVSLDNVRVVIELLKNVELLLCVIILPVEHFESEGLFSFTTFFCLGLNVYFVDFCLKSLTEKFGSLIDW